MKYTTAILFLSLLLTGCGRSDTKLSQQVAGTWWQGKSAMMVFNPNGGFSFRMWAGGRTNGFAGTWQIQEGVMTMTVTNTGNAESRGGVGETQHFKIVRLD